MLAVVIVAIVAVGGAAFFLMNGGGDPDIKYELNGGTNASTNPSSYSDTGITLAEPTRDAYAFDGWYLESNFINKVTVVNKSSEKITLYAKWTPITYNISYVLQHDGCGNNNPTTGTVEDIISLEPLALPYFEFRSWYTSKDLSENSAVKTISGIKSDITLYAGWNDISGKSFEYDLEVVGTESAYGTVTESYYAFTGGKYLTEYTIDLSTYGYSGPDALAQYDAEWDEDLADDCEYLGTKSVETIHGTKTLSIYKSDDGTSTIYTDNAGTPYLIEMISSKMTMTATLSASKELIINDTATIKIVTGSGVSSVTGAGTYKVGDTVTISVDGTSGSYRGISYNGVAVFTEERTVTISACGDRTFYALCENEYGLSAPATISNAKWVVKEDADKSTVANGSGNPCVVELPANRSYTATVTGTDSTGKSYTYDMDVLTGSYFQKTYKWTYNGSTHSMKINCGLSKYQDYKHMDENQRYSKKGDGTWNTHFVTYEDYFVVKLAEYLRDQSSNMNDVQRANYVLAFVQIGIPYAYDKDTKGVNEYWKYPIETLYDGKGDCEDTSILYAAIMKAMGYKVALLVYDDHAAAAIHLTNGSGTYYEKNGLKYYYCETTNSGWTVGQIPDKYDEGYVYVVN